MWNGLWKLTAMVGVIGVGLFAVYQAQKGMNQTTAVSPSSDNTRADEPGSAEEPYESTDSTEKKLAAADFDFDLAPRERKPKKTKKDAGNSDFAFLDEMGKDQPAESEAATKKKKTATIPVKRTQSKGVSFSESEDVDGFGDDTVETTKPKKLPQDKAGELDVETPIDTAAKKPQQTITQTSGTSEDAGLTDGDKDPFGDETAPAAPTEIKTDDSEQPAEFPDKTHSADKKEKTLPEESSAPDFANSKEKSTREEQQTKEDAPGRAQLLSDFGDDPEPPRSARARRNAEKRIDPPAETDSNPFGDDPPADAPLADSNSLVIETPPALTMPDQPAAPAEVEPAREFTSSSGRSKKAIPAANLEDSAPPPRSKAAKARIGSPGRLPADLDSAPLNDVPPPSRNRVNRQIESDRVTPVDMIGDGVAGDVSQRGVQQPRITIEKVAQQQAVLEQPLIYSILIKNVGSVDAHNVVVEDRIPKGTELQGTSPQAELNGKRLIWNYQVLKPNEEKKISIKIIPKQEGPIGSVARVYFATEVSAEIVVAAPQLEFTVKAPREVRVGQNFDLVFSLKNVGKVDAANIVVRDFVPDNLKHEAGSDIECPIGKLAPQEAREIVLPVTAIRTGSTTNQATLTADSGIKINLDRTIDVIGEVLVLTRTGHDRLYVERPATFTNNIRNDGNQKADRVKISEVVPAGMEFETASDGGRYDANLRAVVWTVGPLAPGNEKSVTVKYVPKVTGTHAGKITAVGEAGSTAAVLSTVDVIGKPELQMETLSATGTVTVGERITSRFQLNNTGTAAASQVQLKLRLPPELRLVSVKGAKFQKKNDYIVFDPIDQLAPRAKAAYELVLEPVEEAEAQIRLEISADHLNKPGVRVETIQIARDALK